MSYGPHLTNKQKVKLEAEIAAFDKKKTKETLAKIERESVGKKDVNAYHDFIEENGGIEPSVANPDGLEFEDSMSMTAVPDLKFLSAKIEINQILSHRQRQVWQCCMRDGLSAEAAGMKLNLKTRTVESYLKDAKKKVQAYFNTTKD